MDKINFSDQKQLLFGWLYEPFTIPPGSIDNTLTIILKLIKQYGIDKQLLWQKLSNTYIRNNIPNNKLLTYCMKKLY